MIHMPRGRGTLAAVSAGATVISLLTLNTAVGAARARRRRARPASPWTDTGYQPRPGNWQPYVLAPEGHDVKPAAVSSVDARGGSVQGDPRALLGTAPGPFGWSAPATARDRPW